MSFHCLGPTARPDEFGNYTPCDCYPCDACLKENEMEKISVTVNAPEELRERILNVSVSIQPETTEEFERIVEACGGPAKFTVVGQHRIAMCDIGDRDWLCLMAPKDAPEQRISDPFMTVFDAITVDARAAEMPRLRAVS